MKNKSLQRIWFLIVAIIGASIALGQQPAATNAPSVERLRAHIECLASDKLEGRRTGSSGANLAAEYIAREFSRYGLRRSIGRDIPGMSILEADSPNRYLQKFPYVAGVELGKNNLLSVNSRNNAIQTKVSENWLPLGFSSSSKIDKAGIVFAGYGISAPELKYDDYAASSVKDEVALVFSGTPDGDNPHGQFARAGEVRFKATAAQAAGARALMIIASEPELKNDRLFRLVYDNAGEAAIPVIVVSRELAQQIVAPKKLSDYESVADSRTLTQKPTAQVNPLDEGTETNIPQASLLRLPVYKTTVNLLTDVTRREVSASNVVGILDGSDPTLKNETIVIGAHYDHLGRGGEGSLAPKEGEIHHGADDNASGVAGVLELARMFSAQHPRPRRTIVFMAFSGEEEGLLGSNFYVNHPIVPLANTVAMINMDMIGRMKDNKLIVGGVGTAESWRKFLGLTPTFALTMNEDGYGPSDHSSFYAKQIPVLFFWTGTHEDYHKPSDTADKINYADEARILSLVARVVYDIDNNDKRPVYTVAKSESTGRSMGFRVYLGTIPNYADSTDGLLLDGVRDDSPAAKAGIKAGDKIVKLAGRDVRNVYDYTAALGEMKAGQEYEVELVRAGNRITLKLTPAARK
jgi:Zn-dependent M28 family amino/carboxypeptidase